MLHRGERGASARTARQDNPRDAHRREFLRLLERQLASEPGADRYLQWRGTIGGAFVLAKPRDYPARLCQVFGDSVPSVADLRRALKRRLGMAAQHYRRMGPLHGLGLEPETFNSHRASVVDRRALAPQLFHQRDIFARAA